MTQNSSTNTFTPADLHANVQSHDLDPWQQAIVLDLAPVLVLNGLLLLIGVVGNSMVCYVCTFRMKETVITNFVLSLAVVDLLGCVVSIPVDATEVVNSFFFDHWVLCKLERYFRKFVIFSNVCILVAIAVERYQRIVRPHRNHVTKMQSRYTILGAVTGSLILAAPEAVLAGSETVATPVGEGVVCSTYHSDHFRGTVLPQLWAFLVVLLYVTSTSAIAIIYVIIASKIWKRGKVVTDRRSRMNTPDSTLQRRVRCPKNLNNGNNQHGPQPRQFTRRHSNHLAVPSSHIFLLRDHHHCCDTETTPATTTTTATNSNSSTLCGETQHNTQDPATMTGSAEVDRGQGQGWWRRRGREVTQQYCHQKERASVFFEELVRSLENRARKKSVTIPETGTSAGDNADHGTANHAPKKPNSKKSTTNATSTTTSAAAAATAATDDEYDDDEDVDEDAILSLQPLTPIGSTRRRKTSAHAGGPTGYSRTRTTFIMLVMTVTAIASYFPHVVVMLYRLSRPTLLASLSPDARVAYRLAWNSFFLSLAAHPFVYGFWNGRFKLALTALMTGLWRSGRGRGRAGGDSFSSRNT